jgi:hypothetical protein
MRFMVRLRRESARLRQCSERRRAKERDSTERASDAPALCRQSVECSTDCQCVTRADAVATFTPICEILGAAMNRPKKRASRAH